MLKSCFCLLVRQNVRMSGFLQYKRQNKNMEDTRRSECARVIKKYEFEICRQI